MLTGAATPAVEERGLERGEIAAHHRGEVCIQDRRRSPLELAPLGGEGGGFGDRDAVEPHREGVGRGALVPAIEVAVDQRDRDRLDPLLAERGGERVEVEAVEEAHHLAVRREPLRHLEAAIAGNKRGGTLPLGVEEPADEPPPFPDLEDIAEAFGGDEPGPGPLAFEEGIGGDGRAVNERADRPGRDPERGERVEHPPPLLARNRGHLRGMKGAVLAVRDEVGERPADVHADDMGRLAHDPPTSERYARREPRPRRPRARRERRGHRC